MQEEIVEEVEIDEEKEMTMLTETMTSDPSCPLPDVPSNLVHVALLNPLRSGPSQIPSGSRPLLLYVPGMDCTGQGIRRQLPGLVAAGYVWPFSRLRSELESLFSHKFFPSSLSNLSFS